MDRIAGTTLFHIGVAIMILVVVAAVLSIVIARIRHVRLERQLDEEYGEQPKKDKQHLLRKGK